MNTGIFNIALKSIRYYRKPVFQQVIIIALLASVITGSLMTGYSVKESLKKSVGEKLGRTGFMISSGLRYFKPAVSAKFTGIYGIKTTPVIITEGFIQNFSSGKRSYKTRIYGIDKGFFSFHGIKTEPLKPGEIAVNSEIAAKIGLKPGDEIIITMTPPDDIPSGSPFATSTAIGTSTVFKVLRIQGAAEGGNFSTGISQVTPDIVFMSLDDPIFRGKANTLLTERRKGLTEESLISDLQKIISPDDIGLTVRSVSKTGEYEIISSRIFIDQNIADNLLSVIPGSYPVISYLANSITHQNRSTPYSFIAAMSGNDISEGDNIVVNEWLAKDIDVKAGDSVSVTWYAPVHKGDLVEKSGKFAVSRIAGKEGKWADSLLMPDFPGIAGSKTCSEWNAGVEIKMDRIRKKDEDYWNRYRGTPKAFISYSKGKEIWGNNFGPATAIRFRSSYNRMQADSMLKGKINPSSAGFSSRNIFTEMIRAADNSVDFGTLFLGLGFFIIISCIVILILAVSSWFDSRKIQVATFRSLGFRDRWIRKLLLIETGTIAIAGASAGCIAGILINIIMIKSLNSVWTGAVQTNGLYAFSSPVPILTGFGITFCLSLILLFIKINRSLKKQIKESASVPSLISKIISRYVLAAIVILTVILLTINFTSHYKTVLLSFISGIVLFSTLILIWRIFVTGEFNHSLHSVSRRRILSGSFYSFHPDKAIMPVLLIAAGIFAIVITGVNRQKITVQSLSIKGGTGGLAFWAETSVPVKEDLNSMSGRKIHGLEELAGSGIAFIQGKKVTGDDASCLNLNYISSPPLLGIDPADFRMNAAFSFASLFEAVPENDPWSIIAKKPAGRTIYGFADQTVLEWGLKKKAGDTLRFHSESGELLNIVIAGGLKPSIFQGYLLIGEENMNLFYPSVPGYSILLVRGSGKLRDSVPSLLSDRLENYGIAFSKTSDRLASFFTVTNTYLSVFTMLGFFGMLLGVAGLGFVLNRNYTYRRKEFALMLSSGYRTRDIKKTVLVEQLITLLAGITTGILSGLVSASSSVNKINEIPWVSLMAITIAIAASGVISLLVSIRGIKHQSLISELRKE